MGFLDFGLSEVVGGLFGMEGQRRADSRAHDMSQEQMAFQERVGKESQATDMAFQERMSNTSYQRQMNDLAAAGINPMLGYMKGSGASTPSGASFSPSGAAAPTHNTYGAALEGAAQVAQTRLSSAGAAKTDAEKDLVLAQIPAEQARARRENASAVAEEEYVKQQFPWVVARERTRAQSESTEFSSKRQVGDLEHRNEDNYWQAEKREMSSRSRLTEAEARATLARARLEELQRPAAENQMRYDETGYGKYIRPLLGDIGRVTGSAASALGSASAVKYLMSKPYEGVRQEEIRGRRLGSRGYGD